MQEALVLGAIKRGYHVVQFIRVGIMGLSIEPAGGSWQYQWLVPLLNWYVMNVHMRWRYADCTCVYDQLPLGDDNISVPLSATFFGYILFYSPYIVTISLNSITWFGAPSSRHVLSFWSRLTIWSRNHIHSTAHLLLHYACRFRYTLYIAGTKLHPACEHFG
jgi:hypothetical protein